MGFRYLLSAMLWLAMLVSAVFALMTVLTGQWLSLLMLVYLAVVCGKAAREVGRGVRTHTHEAVLRKSLKQDHPDEPWLWRPDWAEGRVDAQPKRSTWDVWWWIACWNLLFLPVCFVVPTIVEQTGSKVPAALYLFAAGGVVFFVGAVRNDLYRKKYGSSTFEMQPLPAAPGGQVAGVVYTAAQIPPGGAEVTLRCIEHKRPQSSRGTGSMKVLHEQSCRVMEDMLKSDPARTAIPVCFDLPPGVEVTRKKNIYYSIFWVIEIKAAARGMDYAAKFNIPVFDYEPSRSVQRMDRDQLMQYAVREVDSRARLEQQGITIRPAAGGMTLFTFEAHRNPMVALRHGFAFLITLAFFIGPMFLPDKTFIIYVWIVFAGIAALWNAWLGVRLWLVCTEVRVGEGRVEVIERFVGRHREIAILQKENIERIIVVSGWRDMNRTLFKIRIDADGSRPVVAGEYIRSRADAEWLAAEMKRVLRSG